MTLAQGSVIFSFLSLLFSSPPISELTRDPLYLLHLFLIHSLSKTERSEIKAVVPSTFIIWTSKQRATHKLLKSSSMLNPAQHQNNVTLSNARVNKTGCSFFVNTKYWDYKSQHQHCTEMLISPTHHKLIPDGQTGGIYWQQVKCLGYTAIIKASVRFSTASVAAFQPQMEETHLLLEHGFWIANSNLAPTFLIPMKSSQCHPIPSMPARIHQIHKNL